MAREGEKLEHSGGKEHGEVSPQMDQSLSICLASWDHQDRRGCVFLSQKDAAGVWSDAKFDWPQDRQKIQAWFERHKGQNADLYWCPAIFTPEAQGRRKESVLPGRILYADLDPVDPRGVAIRPTVAWESSPGRFQALWWLDQGLSVSELESLNKRLTYSMEGADRGGWDLTQVLRIPNLPNHKYTPPRPGRLLWGPADAPTYGNEELQHQLPIIRKETSLGQLDPMGPTLVELLSRYRQQIPSKVSRLLQYPPTRVEQGKRSDMLWYIESTLIQSEIPQEDIIRMVGLSAWNKYRGRADEWTRLTTEIDRAYQKLREEATVTEPSGGSTSNSSELIEVPEVLPWKPFSQVMAGLRNQPGWLIQDIWLKRSHGIVAGEPKCFKSIITLDMAVSVASGQPLWDQFPVEEQGPVLVVQNENADWIIRDRLEKITASKQLVGKVQVSPTLEIQFAPELPLYFLNNYGYNFADPLHRQSLEVMVQEIKPVLIIFDPLYLMFDGDVNSAKELQPVLFWLLELKNKYNTGVLVVHHWNKNGSSSRGGQRMLGSTTLHGWTESGIFIERKGEDDGTGSSTVTLEREFRAAGLLGKLDLNIMLGEFGTPTYAVEVNDSQEGGSKTALLDLLSMTPSVSLAQAARELGLTTRKLTRLAESTRGVQITGGAKGKTRVLQLVGGIEQEG